MVVNDIDSERSCLESIGSGQFFSYVANYGGNVSVISDVFGDDICVNRINGQFAVVYKILSDEEAGDNLNVEELVAPGLGFVPSCYGLMSVAATEKSGVEALRRLPGLSLYGEGVMVGFIDTGIDYTLDTFKRRIDFSRGRTRIRYIWDQSGQPITPPQSTTPGQLEVMGQQVTSGPTVAPAKQGTPGHFGFGQVYTYADIDAALDADNPYQVVPARDTNGHGTYLASVAVGNDIGIAPESELAVVKLREANPTLRRLYHIPEDEFCCSEDDVMLAVRFLLSIADRERRPMVICLGIGSNQGAHMGSTILERYLTFLSRQRGIGIVAAAGNELGAGSHYRGGSNLPGQPEVEAAELSVERDTEGFTFELWSNAPAFLTLKIISPTGEIFEGPDPRRNGVKSGTLLYEGTKIDIVNVAIDTTTGNQLTFVRFTDAVAGIWTLQIEESESVLGEGFDMWLPISNFTKGAVSFVRPEPDVTICAPGSAMGVITVASYNIENEAVYAASSRGYNREGYIKPDIAASGVDVTGAFAGSGSVASSAQLLTSKSGTSVSTAIVAGMCALILEWAVVRKVAPYITNEEIKQLLIQGTVKKPQLSYPNRSWGWGAADLFEAFSRIRI